MFLKGYNIFLKSEEVETLAFFILFFIPLHVE